MGAPGPAGEWISPYGLPAAVAPGGWYPRDRQRMTVKHHSGLDGSGSDAGAARSGAPRPRYGPRHATGLPHPARELRAELSEAEGLARRGHRACLRH